MRRPGRSVGAAPERVGTAGMRKGSAVLRTSPVKAVLLPARCLPGHRAIPRRRTGLSRCRARRWLCGLVLCHLSVDAQRLLGAVCCGGAEGQREKCQRGLVVPGGCGMQCGMEVLGPLQWP